MPSTYNNYHYLTRNKQYPILCQCLVYDIKLFKENVFF